MPGWAENIRQSDCIRVVTMAACQAIHVRCHMKCSQLQGGRGCALLCVFVCEGGMSHAALTHTIRVTYTAPEYEYTVA